MGLRTRYQHPIGPEFSRVHLDPEMRLLRHGRPPIFVALTGPTKSGKTLAAKYLVTEYGFRYEAMISPVRDLAQELGHEQPDWRKLGELASKLRAREGDDVLAIRLLERVIEDGDAHRIVVDGVLHPTEVDRILALRNSFLLGLSAPSELRGQAAANWYSKGDPSSPSYISDRDQFEQVEISTGQDSHAPNVRACMELAKYRIHVETRFCQESLIDPLDEKISEMLNRAL